MPEPEQAPASSQWAAGGRVSVVLCCLSCALCDLSYSIFAPFLPGFATTVGVPHSWIGAIFAQPMLVMLVLTPFSPSLVHRFGHHSVILLGMLVQAASIAAFASVSLLTSPETFIVVALALRSVQGATSAFFETAAGSLIMVSVPESLVGDAVGWTEAARGIGSLAGPPLGGLLFQLFGFSAPFLITAAAMAAMDAALLCVMVCTRRARRRNADAPDTQPRHVSPATLLRLPAVAAGTVFAIVLAIAVSFLDPTLQPDMERKFDLSPAQIGLLFAAVMLSYILTSIVSGAIASVVGALKQLQFGLVLTAFGYLLLGPAPGPLAAVGDSVAQVAAALVCVGIGAGLGYAPLTKLMVGAARAKGMQMEEVSSSLSALVNGSFCLGAAVGPYVGGVMVQLVGFEWASAALGFALLALPVVMTPCLLPASRAVARARERSNEAADAFLVVDPTTTEAAAAVEDARGRPKPAEETESGGSAA